VKSVVNKTRTELLRFVCGGVANTSVTYLLFILLTFILTPELAYTVTYIAGIGLSYIINTYFVFQTGPSLKTAARFPTVYIVQYIVGLVVLSALTKMGIDSRVSMLAVVILNIPITFVLSRLAIAGKSQP
jgi:putative flippase GtrA